MWTRPFGDMLMDLAGSLLNLNAEQDIVRATSVEMTLPVEVRLRCSNQQLILCADVSAWRWQTGFDLPFGQVKLRLEETRQEVA